MRPHVSHHGQVDDRLGWPPHRLSARGAASRSIDALGLPLEGEDDAVLFEPERAHEHRLVCPSRAESYPQVTRSVSKLTVTSPAAFVLVWLLPCMTMREPDGVGVVFDFVLVVLSSTEPRCEMATGGYAGRVGRRKGRCSLQCSCSPALVAVCEERDVEDRVADDREGSRCRCAGANSRPSWPSIVTSKRQRAVRRRANVPAAAFSRHLVLERVVCQSEWASLRVLADRPLRSWVDHAAAESPDSRQRFGKIAHREVGQRKGIAGATSAKVYANSGDAQVRLPALPLGVPARVQLNAEKLPPKMSGPLRLIGGELNDRQRQGSHSRTINDICSCTLLFRGGRSSREQPPSARLLELPEGVRCPEPAGGAPRT